MPAKVLLKEMLPVGMIIVATVIGLYHYHALPDKIAFHFDRKGQPDNWMPKERALLLVQGVCLTTYLLLSIWTYFMPVMFWWKVLMVLFLCNIHLVTIYYAMGKIGSFLIPMAPSVLLLGYPIYLFLNLRS